jgi:Protein of unknown function (DUF2589)
VDYLNIEFNARIASVTASSTEASSSSEGGWNWGYNAWWCCSANAAASWSNQKKESSSSEEKRQYSLQVRVRAVQDELTPGLRRIMNMLEDGFMKS